MDRDDCARFADLHLHSTASDGSDPPAAVVRRAAAMGFTAIALADHDTMEGVPEAAREAERVGIELIPAVELSTVDGEREIHLLAYGLDPQDPMLRQLLTRLRAGRRERARRMVARLAELGVHIRWEDVLRIAGDENIGRPHIARAMQEAGYIRDISEAFTPEYIGTGGRAYVPREKITTEEAIAQVRDHGGVAVLAHPGRQDGGAVDAATIERYAAAGLQGVECFYARHDAVSTKFYRQLCERLGLLITGGSDDHGAYADQRWLGSVRLPYVHVERLKAAIAANRRR